MRRLDHQPKKKLRNPERHYRSLAAWARDFKGFFPTPEIARDGLWYEKIAIFQKAVTPPHMTREAQSVCAQLILDAARRMRDARPKSLDHVPVYAYLTFPSLFGSFVEVAFEPNPNLFFNIPDDAGRIGDESYWVEYTPLPDEACPLRDLKIPPNFQIRGARVLEFNADLVPPQKKEGQDWIIGELARHTTA